MISKAEGGSDGKIRIPIEGRDGEMLIMRTYCPEGGLIAQKKETVGYSPMGVAWMGESRSDTWVGMQIALGILNSMRTCGMTKKDH